MIDPLKLEQFLDDNNMMVHVGVSQVRLGFTFNFQQLEDALKKHS